MLSPIRVTARQDTDLSTLCDQAPDSFRRAVDRLEKLAGAALTVRQLRSCVEDDLGPEAALSLARQLIALGTLARRRPADPAEVIEALSRGLLSRQWPPDRMKRWEEIRPYLLELMSMEGIRVLVKAIDLSFDYDTLYHSARIITDLRPVFDEKEEKSDIVGLIISQMMRLAFRNEDGHQSISLLMDRHDIEELRAQCEEALIKADLIESRFARSELRTLHVGEDLDELR